MKSLTQLPYLVVAILTFNSVGLFAQTADAVRGCPNLEVNFTAPNQGGFFWDFDDGVTSELQNPQHIFRNAGRYTVTLYDADGGTATGSIIITIYDTPVVNIVSDPRNGCVPLTVNFGADLTIDPAIVINEINWTFGDGGAAEGSSTSHMYTAINVYDVSVELKTELPNCNQFQAFEDEISAEGAIADFSVDKLVDCNYPTDLTFTNNAADQAGNNYQWDFGNGRTSSAYNPTPVTYSDRGSYEVKLIVTTPSGCVDEMTETLIIGEPLIDIDLPDTLCIGQEFQIENRTIAEEFDWKYGTPAIRTFQKEPTLVFSRGGIQEVYLKAANSEDCFKEVTYEVFVDEPDVDFIIDPPLFCKDNIEKTLIATTDNHPFYIWNNNGDTVTTPTFTIPASDERDSLFINLPDSIVGTLTVISQAGCSSTRLKDFKYQLAEAWFLPDTTVGLYPLEVTFTDLSTSQHDIVRRYWDYGDGITQELDPSITTHSHLFDICGEFWVTLVVEDSEGCIDRSKAVKIDAFCPEKIFPEDAECNCTPSDNTFCAGFTGVIAEFSPPTYDFHLYTDEERINHCWKDDSVLHLYDRPGVYPIIPISEYEGVVVDTLLNIQFEIEGTKAIIEHSMECNDPFTYNFKSASMNADELTWTYNGQVVSSARSFDYTFDRSGEHVINLRTINTTDDCPARNASVTLYVMQPEAVIEIPDQMCDNQDYTLNATESKDVFASCYKGYLWEFENQRPRETGSAELRHQFARGHQTVKLTVEDINGCTATATTTTDVYGIEPDFNLDSTTCLPYPKQLLDLSDADTTLVSWDWSFGSSEQNPFYEFTEADTLPGFQDTILVTLEMEDAYGCKDRIEKIVTIEEPNFFIVTDVGTRVCTGESILFTVLDTAGIMNSYDFEWVLGEQGNATGDSINFAFTESGRQEVYLSYRHKNGHCEGIVQKTMIVLPTPDAQFTTDKDGEQFICPGQVAFLSDQELASENFIFNWSFGDETYSELSDPIIEFGVGEHTINLQVSNQLGCKDSIEQILTVIGPDADITADKDAICGEEEVTFTITNLENVSDFSLDLGDGVIVDNELEITHVYKERPTVVTLLMESEEGCFVSDTLPILISEVEASFEFACGGTALNNLSIAGTDFLWEFGDGLTSTEENPEYPYDQLSGSTMVTLTVTDGTTGCIASFSSDVQSTPAFEMANLFSPNGDGRNDRFKPLNLRAAREDEVFIKTFKIYNRWGQLVYDNNNPDGWSGIYEGKLAPPEVYAYFIEMEIPGCGDGVQKGNVTLIR